jgi:adenine-specific DNA-methyltransferase
MTSQRPEFGQPQPKTPRKRRAKPAAARPLDEDRVDDYRHEEATRLNVPEAGMATQDRSVSEKVTYEYDPHLDPQLVWAGKAEHTSFEVDTVSLHIHERVSTEAMMRAVRREEVQRTLFGDPQLSPAQELDFYSYGVDWTNRLILGDSLLVMNSLIRREGMARKIQCIYVDPPYGVEYNSNFQPRVDERQVVNGSDESLTREPEQIRAYRDTWRLGIHSYLTYLRDRLLLAKDLLADSGSIFVQISETNLHHVRELMDEVFQRQNYVGQIAFQKAGGFTGDFVQVNTDFLLWYAKDRGQTKFHPLYRREAPSNFEDTDYEWVDLPDGVTRRMTAEERADPGLLPGTARVFSADPLTSDGYRPATTVPIDLEGRTFHPGQRSHWKVTVENLRRASAAGRIFPQRNQIRFKSYLDDFPFQKLQAYWNDTGGAGKKVYVVQTSPKVVARCILMTTDPGDLVLDPTCGSGTTAYVAEQWGRRWITCDTSRVALALARQRLMTASYDWYELADAQRGVDGGFVYRTVPHVTLRSIAQDEPPETETLYDQPRVDRRKTRVSGPFTGEQIPSFGIEQADGDGTTYDPGALDERDRSDDVRHRSDENPVSSISELVDLLRIDGVRLPGGRHLEFTALAPTMDGGQVHAEGEYLEAGKPRRIAVSFGPLHGPVSARQVEDVLRDVVFQPYHAVLFAGFAFDAGAQQYIQNYRAPKNLQVLSANIAADVLVPDLLKNRRGQQLFAVFGEPDARLHRSGADFTVELLGMDIYDPSTGDVSSAGTDGVAAWFLDSDYDRRSFLVSQAFFPGAGSVDPWARLGHVLRGWVDPDAFEMLRGTISLPFSRGEQGRAALKVIDFRGNEAVKIIELPEA